MLATEPDSNVMRLSCSALAANYGVDSNFVADTTQVLRWLQQQRQDYAHLASQCSLMDIRVQNMQQSLKSTYEERDGVLWIDSMTCIVGHKDYLARLATLSSFLRRQATQYDRLEQRRIVEEIKEAENKAKRKAQQEQEARNEQLTALKQSIVNRHQAIGRACDANGVTDKNKIKSLKDIYYAYLTIYNKYDLSQTVGSEAVLKAFQQLESLQVHLQDSILGPNSFAFRIDDFRNKLKLACGKDHVDVYKSYLRVAKRLSVPATFSSLAEYYDYAQQLADIIELQQNYIRAIDLRQQIAAGTTDITARCGKNYRNILTSYRTVLGQIDQIPAFITLGESLRFLSQLEEFVQVQKRYTAAIDHIEMINKKGTQVVAACPPSASDLPGAYRALVEAYNFVPDFATLDGADFYEQTLLDFEKLQSYYLSIIALRDTINHKETSLLKDSGTPKEVSAGYKTLKAQFNFTPNFTNTTRAEAFIDDLHTFINIEERLLSAVGTQKTLDANSRTLKELKKENPNTVKAYELLRSEAEQKIIIGAPADIERFTRYQASQLKLQTLFLKAINSADRADYNNRLKKVKETDKIRLIMGI